MFLHTLYIRSLLSLYVFFFQAEDGIRDLVRSRGLGDVYKRQDLKEYADGWMTERKGTDAPGFLKLVIPIIGLGGFLSLIHI